MKDRVYLIKTIEEFVDNFLSEVYAETWKGRRDFDRIEETVNTPLRYPCVIETEEVLASDYGDGDYGGLGTDYITIYTISYE